MSRIRNWLVRVGAAQPTLTLADCLRGGFISAAWCTTTDAFALFDKPFRDFLGQVDLTMLDIASVAHDDRAFKDAITTRLAQQGDPYVNWFDIGFFCYGATRALAETPLLDENDARASFVSDPQLRSVTVGLIDALQRGDLSPDEIEPIILEKVLPILWQPTLRKWSGRLELPVCKI